MKAQRPFFLDGGYDFDSVEGCPHHPEHRWVTVRLADVIENWDRDDEEFTFCRACYAPRCGYVGDRDRCTLWRHHSTAHVYESGRREPVGGYGVAV